VNKASFSVHKRLVTPHLGVGRVRMFMLLSLGLPNHGMDFMTFCVKFPCRLIKFYFGPY